MIKIYNKSYEELQEILDKYNDDEVIIYCFDDKTELLTKDGWKNIKDIKINDYLLSREPNTKKLEYVKNTREIQIDYNGYMYSYEGKEISIFVSENHNLFVNKPFTRKRIYKDVSIQAKNSYKSNFRFISAGGIWDGTQDKTINILGKEYDKIKFARLLGIFLTDGSINNQNLITISQTKKDICELIEKLLRELNIEYSVYNSRLGKIFYIHKKYKDYFKQFYLKENRKIPQDFKDANVEVLNSLMEGILDGDSDKERRKIILSSKSLCDDIMEIAYKIGKSSSYKIIKPKKIYLKSENRYINGVKNCYCISIKNKPYLQHIHKNEKKIKYNGKLYCCCLEKWHTVLMRRNGKCVWINQCDIPYKSTANYYENQFDYEKFYSWLKNSNKTIFISEYNMPNDFKKIFSIKKQKNFSGVKKRKQRENIENLYINKEIKKEKQGTLL